MAATPDDAARAVRRLLDEHAASFGRPSALGLRLVRTDVDELGFMHLRFATQHAGRTVFGGEVRAHFSSTGELRHLRSNSWTPAPTNAITRDEESARVAAAIFARQLRPDLLAVAFTTLSPQLVVLPLSPLESRFAHRVTVTVDDLEGPMRLQIFVDAEDDQILRWFDEARRLAVVASGDAGDCSIEVALRNGRYYLEDTTGPTTLKTYSARHREALPGTVVSSTTLDGLDRDGVDLHANLRLAYDYFRDAHGLERWLDGNALRATMRFGLGYNNAFFDGAHLGFGDGDGVTYLPLGRDPDIVAHEVGHSVIHALTELVPVDETGAIDEGIADLFAAFAASRRGSAAAWQIGERVHRCDGEPCPLRDLAAPDKTGSAAHLADKWTTYEDHGGVHYNSTIVSHAGYLMVFGSKSLDVPRLGRAVTERIWFRALQRYLPADADFVALCEATMAAASDLDEDVEAVRAAWLAVGIEAKGEWL